MNPSLHLLEKALQERYQVVADCWYEAIAQTSYVSLDAAEVRRRLADLAEQAAMLLAAEPVDRDQAQEIGAALAQLHCLQPETLGRTIGVLSSCFGRGLPAEQAVALQPRLAVLIDGVITGFERQTFNTILAEQEAIRGALIDTLQAAEQALRAARDELETRVQDRTSELARANEELRSEIAERKRMEEALCESEKTARVLLNAPTDLVVLVDTNAIILDINEAMAHRFGKQVSELIGTSGWDLVSPDMVEHRKGYFEEALRSGKPVHFEDERLGTWFDNRVYPVCDAQGKVTRVALLARDITRRKRMEEALRESEERYRALSELMSDFAYATRVEPDGRLVAEWVAGAYTPITDFTPEESMVRSNWESLMHPEDLAIARHHLQVILSGQVDVCEYRIIAKSGEVHWLRNYGHPQWDEAQGRVVRILAAAQDITERKQMVEALRESEERWRTLVENAPDLVLTVDAEGRILFVNHVRPGATTRVDSFLGRNVCDFAMPEARERTRKAIEKVFVEGSNEYFEAPAGMPNGAVAWFANHLGPIRRHGEVVATMIISRDITDRKEIDEMKDNLIRDVSHELRTPLAKMQMSLELLLEVLNKEPINHAKATEIGAKLFGYTQRLLQTVEAILDLSALEAGRVVYEKIKISPGDLLDETLQYMRPVAEAKGLELVANVPQDLPAVQGDLEKLSRVMINLIDNAIKFSEQGQIILSARRNGHEVEFAVSDTGYGLLKESLDRVFERFYQERPGIAGAGVGLSICKRIVEAHGGRIWAESAGRGQGATLRFTLPVTVDEKE